MTTVLEPLPVSVIIPAYDRAALTAAAARSALGQQPRPPAEVLVIDDCSSDGTAQAAEAAGARVIRHERNLGRSQARNTGIQQASNPWIATLDSDDRWFGHHLAALWPYTHEAVLVAGSALACGADPNGDRVWGVGGRRPHRLAGPADLLSRINFVVTSGAMVRRDALLAAGGFDASLSLNEDIDLWLRVLEHGPAVILPAVTVRYAIHVDQTSHDRNAMRQGYREVVSAYEGRSWWSPKRYDRLDGAMRWDEFRAALSRRSVGEALRAARGIVARPERLRGTASLLNHRLRERRATSRVTRSGTPSIQHVDAHVLRVAWRLVRRPPGRLVTKSRLLRLVARAAGIEVVTH